MTRIPLGAGAFSAGGGGPRGVAVTPDGASVIVAVAQGGVVANPMLYRIDAITGTVAGSLVTPYTWPRAVGIQRY